MSRLKTSKDKNTELWGKEYHINEKYLMPFSNHSKLPQLLEPEPKRNGKIEKIDGKITFQYQPSDHPDFCTKLGNKNYDAEEMLYTVNKQNFRSDEFDSDTGLLTVGCSYTYGIGLRDNEVYSRKLAKMFNLPLWNLSAGALGPEACLLLTKQFLLAGKTPKAIVIQWPSINRKLIVKQIYTNEKSFYTWSASIDSTSKKQYFENIAKGKLMSSDSWTFDFYLIREQLILLAKLNNIPIVEISPAFYPDDAKNSIFKNCVHNIRYVKSPWSTPAKESSARDNLHHGEDSHNLIAEQLYNLLDKEL